MDSCCSDYQWKEKRINLLRKKALDKNPDEFYMHMINSGLKNGTHFEKRKDGHDTLEQMMLMQSQDRNYVQYKLSVEMKKINRLKSSLHLLDVEEKPKNKHTFFVHTKEEAKCFDVAKKLNTHPSCLETMYNVPTIEKLKKMDPIDDGLTIENGQIEKEKSYKELTKRLEREKQLKALLEKMETKKHIMVSILKIHHKKHDLVITVLTFFQNQNKRNGQPVKMKEGTEYTAPQFKWAQQRKK